MRYRSKKPCQYRAVHTWHDTAAYIESCRLLHDDLKPEDLDTESEDHIADEWRYACQSRPWAKPTPKDQAVDLRGIERMTFDEALKMHENGNGSRWA